MPASRVRKSRTALHSTSGTNIVASTHSKELEASVPVQLIEKDGEKPPRIPRPENAFMLFRKHFCRYEYKPGHTDISSAPTLSKFIGRRWKALPKEEKLLWFAKAKEVKALHAERNPDYKFSPVSKKDKVRTGKEKQLWGDKPRKARHMSQTGRRLPGDKENIFASSDLPFHAGWEAKQYCGPTSTTWPSRFTPIVDKRSLATEPVLDHSLYFPYPPSRAPFSEFPSAFDPGQPLLSPIGSTSSTNHWYQQNYHIPELKEAQTLEIPFDVQSSQFGTYWDGQQPNTRHHQVDADQFSPQLGMSLDGGATVDATSPLDHSQFCWQESDTLPSSLSGNSLGSWSSSIAALNSPSLSSCVFQDLGLRKSVKPSVDFITGELSDCNNRSLGFDSLGADNLIFSGFRMDSSYL